MPRKKFNSKMIQMRMKSTRMESTKEVPTVKVNELLLFGATCMICVITKLDFVHPPFFDANNSAKACYTFILN